MTDIEMRIILETTPASQSKTEMTFRGGQLTVGRGEDAGWRIYDPDHFVSRKHFVVSQEGTETILTDASTGGLFVNGASAALGAGNSVRAEHGMRLRFGDFVARIEFGETADKPKSKRSANSPFNFNFEPAEEKEPPTERPDTLPEPFGVRSSSFFDDPSKKEDKIPDPIDRDDPFALDVPRRVSATGAEASRPSPSYFFGSEDMDAVAPIASEPEEVDPEPVEVPVTAPQEEAHSSNVSAVSSESDVRAAFFRGLGIEIEKLPEGDPVEEMEALGKRFRALADGVTHLLRTRSTEKQRARIAQTIIGSSNVNPLKFAVSTDEAVSALVIKRGVGYLDPDESVDEAFRDLVDHQIRTWSALQTALRAMMERFDPVVLEKELEDTGLLEQLIAGGRSAKLWQLYEERYAEIARSAEQRFLGEIGADFRDAYEK